MGGAVRERNVREFTVVFVGYSVSDPVMGYLVDALAAEREMGARITKAYAFADHDGAREDAERARSEWEGEERRAHPV